MSSWSPQLRIVHVYDTERAELAPPRIVTPHLDWQPQLMSASPSYDLSFSTYRRHRLDAHSWVDHVPGWLTGGDSVFEEVLGNAVWTQSTTKVWDHVGLEPRLHASWPDGEWPEILETARELVSERYNVHFTSVRANLYRDARDSVAWHRDRVHRQLETPLVCTISLGAQRTFAIRPRGGGHALRLRPASGDLIVMGGRCQQDWEHAVPKCADARPRIAITIRHYDIGA